MEMLNNLRQKAASVVSYPQVWNDAFLISVIVLVGVASFGLGRISIQLEKKDDFAIVYPDQAQAEGYSSGEVQGVTAFGVSEGAEQHEGGFVASKSGAKYHLPWCAGAQSIKPENKIYFETKQEAEAAGYAPAGNCKGL